MSPRPPRRFPSVACPTPEQLTEAALRYLEKFAASESRLRRVLKNRLIRAAHAHPTWAEDTEEQARLAAHIESLIVRYRDAGVLNDASFAAAKVVRLRRAGRSAQRIAAGLRADGVAEPLVRQALAHHANESVDPEENSPDSAEALQDAELKAARALARRRRLGPFREGDSSPERLRRETGILLRAGFSYTTARQVLGRDAWDPETENGDT